MADDFNVVFSADDRDLINSYLQQTDKIQKLQLELKKWQKEAREAGAASEKAAKDGTVSADAMIKGVTGIAAGWMSATSAVLAYIDANKEAIGEAESVADKLDSARRRTQLLTRLRGKEAEEFNQKVEKQAIEGGVSPTVGHQIAQQMAGSGFEQKEITGGSLKAFIDVLSATGEDPNSSASAGKLQNFSQYLASQGISKNAENIKTYGKKIQALMGPTDLSFENMSDLSNVSAGFKGLLSPDEQFAMFANLVSGKKGAPSATAAADIVKNFSIVGSKPDAVRELKKMGMKPEDINLIGENLGEALDRTKAGLERIPEDDRRSALAKIFEGSNADEILYLMENRKAIYDLIPGMNNNVGFDADAALMQAGRVPATTRLAGQKDLDAAGEALDYGARRQAHQNAMRRGGYSAFRRTVAGWTYDAASGLGNSPESSQSAADWLVNPLPPVAAAIGWQGRQFVERETEQSLARAKDPAAFTASQQEEARARAEHTAAMERNTAAVVKNNELMGKSQVPVVPRNTPRPIAGAGRPQ